MSRDNLKSSSDPMQDVIVIAVDGPGGSGKSTVSRELAQRLGLGYLDTGAMYRVATLAAKNWGFSETDFQSDKQVQRFVDKLAKTNLEFSLDPEDQKTHLGPDDVTAQIRSPEVDAMVSHVAACGPVRELMVANQKSLIMASTERYPGVVVEGRDIGTVVAPSAQAKFFVTASPLVRATRRALQFDEGDANRGADRIAQEAQRLAARDEVDSSRAVSPLTQANDASVIDSSQMSVFETVSTIEAQLLEKLGVHQGLPRVVIVGRPNVGKSTLVNRLTASGRAVTEDKPGVTRDAVSYECEWNGREFQLIDTGGWAQKGEELGLKIADIAKESASRADLVLFVVDASVGVTAEDEQLAAMLRKLGVRVLSVVNKADDTNLDAAAGSFWSLGFGEPQQVSALQGRHSGDLLDEIVARLPELNAVLRSIWPKVAIVGQPNVGKSSLLNALARGQIALTADMPGTTVDPVDEVVQIGDRVWQLMDTAGLRRKSHTAQGHEYYASIRSERVIEDSDLVLLLIDATQGVGEQDKRLASMIDDYGRGLVVVMNKWDLLDEDSRERIEAEYASELGHVSWAPRVNISATTGRNLEGLTKALAVSWDSYKKRISTARLNALVEEVVISNPHPIRGGKQPKMKYASQVGVRPPTFVLHARGKLDATYLRFIERRLREQFGFEGTPLRLRVKPQKRG